MEEIPPQTLAASLPEEKPQMNNPEIRVIPSESEKGTCHTPAGTTHALVEGGMGKPTT